jgi:WD40 repeat protein/beta-lactamase regulating signal transducer with metallopeptidase domain
MTESFAPLGLLARLTMMLSIAWLVNLALARANPRWRVLTWRLTAAALLVMGIVAISLPAVSVAVLPAEAAGPMSASAELPMLPAAGRAEKEPADANPNSVSNAVPIDKATTRRGAELPKSVPNADTKSAAIIMRINWHWIVVVIWLCGVSLGALSAARAMLLLRNLRKRSLPVDPKIVELGQAIALRLNLRSSFEIRQTSDVPSPCVFGVLHPVILLPTTDCQPEQRTALPAILAHEIAHLANHDVVWNSALRALARLLWFHPLLWRAPAAHLAACDAACDATAASYIGDVVSYGQLLAQMALRVSGASHRPALQMARASNVRRRIETLHQRLYTQPLSRRGVIVTAAVTLFLAGLTGALALTRAQTTAKVDLYGDPLPPGATARLGTIRYQQDGRHFLPDNQTVVSKDGGSLVLWNARTGAPIRELRVKDFSYFDHFTLSADGKQVAIPGTIKLNEKESRQEIRVLNLANGELIRAFPRKSIHDRDPVAFTPDGKNLVSIELEGMLRIEEIATGKELKSRSFPRGSSADVDVSPDGKWLGILTGWPSRQYLVWEWQAEAEPRPLNIGENSMEGGLVFSPSGQHVAAKVDGQIHLWEVSTGALLKRPTVTGEGCLGSLAFSPDGKRLFAAVGTYGKRSHGVRVWNVETWESERILEIVNGFQISPDAKLLQHSGWQVVDLETRKVLNMPDTHREEVCQIERLGNDKIMTASIDGTIRTWDAATGRQTQSLDYGDWVRSIAVSPDGQQLVANVTDDTIRLWDLKADKEIYRLPGHRRYGGSVMRAIAFLEGGKQFCSFGPDFYLRVYDTRRGKAVQEFRIEPPGAVLPTEGEEDDDIERTSVSFDTKFTPDGKYLSLDLANKIFFYESLTGKLSFALDHTGGWIGSQSFSPDGQRLLTCAWASQAKGKEETATLWNLQTKKVEVTIEMPDGIGPVCFSPDGKRFAVVGNDDRPRSKVTIYKLNGEVVATLSDVPRRIKEMSFTADGQGLITALDDGTLLVWGPSALVPPT